MSFTDELIQGRLNELSWTLFREAESHVQANAGIISIRYANTGKLIIHPLSGDALVVASQPEYHPARVQKNILEIFLDLAQAHQVHGNIKVVCSNK